MLAIGLTLTSTKPWFRVRSLLVLSSGTPRNKTTVRWPLAAAEHKLFSSTWGRCWMLCLTISGGCLAAGGSARVAPARLSSTDLLHAQETLQFAAPASESPPQVSTLSARLSPEVAARKWEYIVLHHSATEGATVEAIDTAHRARKDAAGKPWLGIGYHFVVGDGQGIADGLIEPTFRWRDQIHGAHSGDRPHNDAGIGICLVGNFDEHPPSQRQIAATRKLIADLQKTYAIRTVNVVVHRDLSVTNCPGKEFDLQQFITP